MKRVVLAVMIIMTLASCAKLPVAVSKTRETGEYMLVGEVEASSYAVLGMWGTDGSYDALVEAAKSKYPGEENIDVIDVSISAKNYFLWYTFDLRGRVIKYSE